MTTPNMGLTLPVDHASNDVWDVILDAAFGLIDAHDHTAGKGPLIPMAALNVNADLSFSAAGVQRAITDLRAIDFSPQPAAAMTALAGAFFLSDGTSGLSANELYYRTTGGANVKVTSGSALNVAGFTGGIGGDYSSVSALELFDDATDAYWFQQQVGNSVRQYARMRSGDLDLYEYKAHPTAGPVPTNRVRLASPAALAASYAITLLSGLPASQQLLQVTAAGQLLATNTVAQPIVMAASQDITISGTAKFKYPTVTEILSPYGALAGNVNASAIVMPASNEWLQISGSAAGCFAIVPLHLRVGWHVTAIRVRGLDNATGPTKFIPVVVSSTDGVTTVISTSPGSSGAAAWQTIAATLNGGGLTVAAGVGYNLHIALTGGGNACGINHIEIDYDQP